MNDPSSTGHSTTWPAPPPASARSPPTPATSTVRAVIVATTPLLARVGIAETATPVTNSIPGYTPVVDDVVVVARVGRRQYITGKT